MPNRQASRTHKSSPNEKGRLTNAYQERCAFNNRQTIKEGGVTPWQAQKARRLADREKAGKTFTNWYRSNKHTSERPSVTNLEVE